MHEVLGESLFELSCVSPRLLCRVQCGSANRVLTAVDSVVRPLCSTLPLGGSSDNGGQCCETFLQHSAPQRQFFLCLWL